MTDTHHVELILNQMGRGTVTVDEKPISASAVSFQTSVGEPATVTIEVPAVFMDAVLDADLRIIPAESERKTELPSISEGRAYHAGDVVIVRPKDHLSNESRRRLRFELEKVTEQTGVEFVIFDEFLEILEPVAAEPTA
jgi:hypothetical protein